MNLNPKGVFLGVAAVFTGMALVCADSQMQSTTVVALDGNRWRVAADPENAAPE